MALTAELTRERDLGVLFTEHSMDVVFTYAQQLLVLSRGEMIARGSPAQFATTPKCRRVSGHRRDVPRARGAVSALPSIATEITENQR